MIKERIDQTLAESIETKEKFWATNRDNFFVVAQVLLDAIQAGKKIMVFGNGGSACDAMHFSGELVNRFRKNRKPLACIALTADSPLITCIGNDFSFDDIFKKQIEALGQEGDIAFGITTSGNSENVIRAIDSAKELSMTTVLLLGKDGGKLASNSNCDHILNVEQSNDTMRIQECHEWLIHSFCEFIDHHY